MLCQVCRGSGRRWFVRYFISGVVLWGLMPTSVLADEMLDRATNRSDQRSVLQERSLVIGSDRLVAQGSTPDLPPPQDLVPGQPSFTPIPDLSPDLPSPVDLNIPEIDVIEPDAVPSDTFVVQSFQFLGNTQFTDAELAALLENYTGQVLSYLDLIEVTQAITRFYVEQGYITSSAVIRSDRLADGIAVVQVVEGQVDEIVVTGTERLRPSYVRSRLARGTTAPLNQERLLDALQRLQNNPLIDSFDARLVPSVTPGSTTLTIDVNEADSLSLDLVSANDRSPSVGSFRRGAVLTEANLLGGGDRLSVDYSNTDGSDVIDLSYGVPINAQGGELSLRFGTTSNRIIEPPFNELDIESSSQSYDLSLRQPLWQSARQEFAVGLALSHYRSRSLLDDSGIALSPGSDSTGRLRISALRFSQEWTSRSPRSVLALRSQVNLGVDLFDASRNDTEPDSQFLSWQGQAQWVQLLAPDTLLYLRGEMQLADQPLVPVEQFSLGGFNTVRGYRQDAVIADNGALAAAELRLPVLRVPEWQAVLQLCPFIEAGWVWNQGDRSLEQSSLASIGLGLQWQQPNFTLRVDWATPLTTVQSSERTWQENGVLFSITAQPF